MSAEHSSMARSLWVLSVTVVLGLGGGGRAEAQQPPSPREPPGIEWQRTFGGSGNDEGLSVEQTSDGGYVVCGSTQPFGAGDVDVYLVKTSPSGKLEWQRTFGGRGRDVGESVQQTSDGGYVVCGWTASFGAGGRRDAYLLKTSPTGELEWQRTFGGTENDFGYSVQQTSDGGYVLCGNTLSFGAGGFDVYLVKTSPLGEPEWQRTFGGRGDDVGFSVQQTSDGGYVLCGYTASFGAGGNDVYLVKTSSSGELEWQQTFGGGEGDGSTSVEQTSDGGYVLCGGTRSFGAGEGDAYLLKTSPSGELEWQQTFGGREGDLGWSVEQTSDGGFVVGGVTASFGAGGLDAYLLKTSPSGELEWQRTFGGSDDDSGWSVQQTSDGGYVLCGETGSFGAGGVYLVKVRSGHFRRGDATADGDVNITDAVFTLNHLFLGGPAPACADAADADDNGDLEITDPVYTLNRLFLGGPELPAPGATECGSDPTDDALDCQSYHPCGA